MLLLIVRTWSDGQVRQEGILWAESRGEEREEGEIGLGQDYEIGCQR